MHVKQSLERGSLQCRRGGLARRLILAALLFGAILASGASDATGAVREIRIGILNHDTDGLWSGFRREHGTDLNAEVIFDSSAQLLHGSLRPAVGATVSTRGGTSKVYVCGRWEYEFLHGAFVALGFGAAWHDGNTDISSPDRKALGSKVLFHTAVEIGYMIWRRHSVSVYFDHMSNAGLADENEGMDTLGIRYGVRF